MLDLSSSIGLTAPTMLVSGLATLLLSSEVGGLKNTVFLHPRSLGQGESAKIPKLRTIHPRYTEGKNEVTYGTFDHRAKRIGKLVRQSGIDEFPQIVSVLKGDLSMVGPRPLPEVDIEHYQNADPTLFDEWYSIYSSIRPGLCGPSQIMRHGLIDTSNDKVRIESMRLDLEYIETASLRKDIGIIALTPLSLVTATSEAYKQRA